MTDTEKVDVEYEVRRVAKMVVTYEYWWKCPYCKTSMGTTISLEKLTRGWKRKPRCCSRTVVELKPFDLDSLDYDPFEDFEEGEVELEWDLDWKVMKDYDY